ncbi:MAG: AzlC family ABC transporter permease [Candidatus Nanopelagicales bacterium]|jgi:predicted branched-subunit amino acid permease|nr:AzlC family ABC transporter permease [Candidatus Nanopelagicales bacterium]HPE12882.1 AzlC family ABC transporter permease [Actinomycetota bacterium]HPJ18157.1 AzlC family ABC transporter permease [Actinomycetota bacterium]HRV65019.1 AzlC family ABC transporter permease [Candidatus Nanopelagicales bacterium]
MTASQSPDDTRRGVVVEAVTIGATTGAYGVSFGALSITSGLSVWQTMALSALMFTGASQFAMVSVLAGGGSAAAAIASSGLLGLRNLFYGLRIRQILQPSPALSLPAAHLTIDESTAMALAHYDRPTPRPALAFWSTGASVFVLWNLGSLVGALGADSIGDPTRWGLDAAVPAAFLALLWPQITDRRLLQVAVTAAVVGIALTPVLSPGLPVLCAALVPFLFLRRTS